MFSYNHYLLLLSILLIISGSTAAKQHPKKSVRTSEVDDTPKPKHGGLTTEDDDSRSKADFSCDDRCLKLWTKAIGQMFKSQKELLTFNKTMDKMSRALTTTKKGKAFLRQFQLSPIRPVERVFASQINFSNCDKTQRCSCDIAMITCDPPKCPTLPTNGKDCADVPECDPRCSVSTTYPKSSSERDIIQNSEENPASIMMETLPKLIRKDALETIPGLILDWLNKNPTRKDTEGKQVVPSVDLDIAALLGRSVGGEVTDKLSGLIMAAIVESFKSEVPRLLCPCPASLCGINENLYECQGTCGNWPGCEIHSCVCPANRMIVSGKHGHKKTESSSCVRVNV